MSARRCPDCGTNWPLGEDYLNCPRDGAHTRFRTNEEPIPSDEARSYLPLTEDEAIDFAQRLATWDGTIPT